MSGPFVRIENLCVLAGTRRQQPTPIVEDVSLSVTAGEVLALIGESGSGKTTVALATLGYTRPGCRVARGRVLIDGDDVMRLDAAALRRLRGRRVAYVAQNAAATFNPALTVGEQVTEAAVLHGLMSREEADARAVELYERLDLPEPRHLGRRYPHQLSGGQLQRLMAAMALCARPELLILDEPTTALDVTTQIELLAAFKDVIRDQRTAVVYVSHDLAVVAQIADRIMVLRGGRVVEHGDTEEIISRPGHDYTRRLMAAIRPPPAEAVRARRPRAAGIGHGESPIMTVAGVTAGYGRIVGGVPQNVALHDIDLVVDQGGVVGVIGESGSGKSTLARVIAGLLPAARGSVALDGKVIPRRVEDRVLEDIRSVQLVFQIPDVALNPRQRIDDIVARPLELYLGLSGAARQARLFELLGMVDLPAEFARRYPGELSGGQKQRVNLARALAASPAVVLADEVTSSLDTIVATTVIGLLADLGKRLRMSYVFISHDLSTVASFADRIVVLYAGRIVEDGSSEQVLAPPFHPYTRLLLSAVPELRTDWLDDVMRTRVASLHPVRDPGPSGSGCPFRGRCPVAIPRTCDENPPPVREPAAGHRIACHHDPGEL